MLRFDPRLTVNAKKAEAKKAKYLALKLYAIGKKGYSCSVCSMHYNVRSMSFHHTEDMKESCIATIIHRLRDRKVTTENIKELDDELDKSILVCENCHQKIHEFESYTSDTYGNAIHYLTNLKKNNLTGDFIFDNNKFKRMYEENNNEDNKSCGSQGFIKRKLEPSIKTDRKRKPTK